MKNGRDEELPAALWRGGRGFLRFGGWFGLRVRGCIRGRGACDTVKKPEWIIGLERRQRSVLSIFLKIDKTLGEIMRK